MVNKIKSCVFISGNGSNLKALIKSSRDYSFPIKIQLIISKKPSIKKLTHDLLKFFMEPEAQET